MSAVIWSKDNCIFCDKAKQLLHDLDITYEERSLSKDWTKDQLLQVVPNALTVPQIFIDNVYIGGYTELIDYKNSL
jgi:glutaredoxin